MKYLLSKFKSTKHTIILAIIEINNGDFFGFMNSDQFFFGGSNPDPICVMVESDRIISSPLITLTVGSGSGVFSRDTDPD